MALRVPEATFLGAPDWFDRCEAPLTVAAEAPTPRRVLEVQARARRSTQYAFSPETVGDGTAPRVAASLGLVVHLDPVAEWPDGALGDLTDYYLHAPSLRVPVEPLGVLARALAEGEEGVLWTHYREVLGVNYHVDAEGRVSLSERWARAGRHFGRVGETPETWRSSDLWRHVEGWREHVLATLDPCSTCAHFPACGGFWRATGEPESSCEGWRASMDALVHAFREVAETAPEAPA